MTMPAEYWQCKLAAFLAAIPWDAFGLNHNAVAGMFSFSKVEEDLADQAVADVRGFAPVPVAWPASLKTRHPLSNQPGTDINRPETDIGNALLGALHEISKRYPLNGNLTDEVARRRFFAVWRLLRENACAKLNDPNKRKLLALFPALPERPTFSIWEQASVASAFAGACYVSYITNEKRHSTTGFRLVLANIASTQDFISNARRTQDFASASAIVSRLAWAAARPLAAYYGPDCFLNPDLRAMPLVDDWLSEMGLVINGQSQACSAASFPNVFSVLLPVQLEMKMESCTDLETQIRESVEQERDKIFKAVHKELGNIGNMAASAWKLQQAAFLNGDIFVASAAWDGINMGKFIDKLTPLFSPPAGGNRLTWSVYSGLVKTITSMPPSPPAGCIYHAVSLLAGRMQKSAKNLRPFPQINESGEKCSLCGGRQALCGPIHSALIRKNERLCAVCSVKRLAHRVVVVPPDPFPSTSALAVAPFKRQVLEVLKKLANSCPEMSNAVDDFMNAIEKYAETTTTRVFTVLEKESRLLSSPPKKLNNFLSLDGLWLYKESYLDNEEQIGSNITEQGKNEILKSLEKLVKIAQCRPGRYFAAAALDGDHMGQWVQGLKNPRQLFHILGIHVPAPLEPQLHLAFSRALSDYSLRMVPIVVEDYCAALVYAGGDDVLLLAAPEELSGLLPKLRGLFDGSLGTGDGYIMDPTLGPDALITVGNQATLSAGAVIAHHKRPLSAVLRETQTILKKEAKEKAGRDAVAIRLCQRSGGVVTVSSGWAAQLAQGLAEVSGYFENDLSPAIVYKMRQETDGMMVLRTDLNPIAARRDQLDRQKKRLTWLVWRHAKDASVTAKPMADSLTALLVGLGADSRRVNSNRTENLVDSGWRRLVNLMTIAKSLTEGD